MPCPYGRWDCESGGSADAGGFAGFLLAVGDGGFGDAEAGGGGGQCGPIGAFPGQEQVVDFAMGVGFAAERGADGGRDGKAGEDLLHGTIEDCVGNREQAHEEEIGTLHGRENDLLRRIEGDRL